MAEQKSAKDEVLERWCEACTAKAYDASGRNDLTWKRSGDNIYRYHCPNPDGDHKWQGADHTAWAVVAGGVIKSGCRVCADKGSGKEDEYTAAIKALVGWEEFDDGTVLRRGVDYVLLREHVFDVFDGRFQVRMQKVRVGRRKNPTFWYQLRKVDPELRGFLAPAWVPLKAPNEWVQATYPVLGNLNAVLHLYHHDDFHADGVLKDIYRVAFCEGPKDADTLRDLLATVPESTFITTALPSPRIKALAPHQEALLRGRKCVVVPDGDKGGDDFAKCWSGLLHPVADEVKILDARALFGEGMDLTDWVEAGRVKGEAMSALARKFLTALSATAAQTEPLETPNSWRAFKKGEKGVLKTSPYNAKKVWTEHPDLIGRVRLNSRSGDIEVVDPPWGGGTCHGARRAAMSCAIWLEGEFDVFLSPRTLADALDGACVAIDHNPLGVLLEAEWDGVPRLDGLFTHYLPLEAPQGVAVRLARLFMSDLVAKIDGKLRGQSILIGICTDEPVDVAGALLGAHGIKHRGKVEMQQVAQFARDEAALVQVSTEPIVDRNMARGSIAHLFASDVPQPHGRISTPLFVAVGRAGISLDGAVESHVDERCLLLSPAGPMRVAALEADAVEIVAEAVARREELDATPIVKRSELRTVDEVEADENLLAMLRFIDLYDRYAIDTPEMVRRAQLALGTVPVRSAPREFIVREQFLDVFRDALSTRWRSEQGQAKVFNLACRALGFVEGKNVKLTMTKRQAASVGYFLKNPDNYSEGPPGVRITAERRARLRDALAKYAIGYDLDSDLHIENSKETAGLDSLHSRPLDRIGGNIAQDSPTRARARINKEGERAEILIREGQLIEVAIFNGGWAITLDGEPIDADAVATAIKRWPPWEDDLCLVSAHPDLVREWLGEIGAEADVSACQPG